MRLKLAEVVDSPKKLKVVKKTDLEKELRSYKLSKVDEYM